MTSDLHQRLKGLSDHELLHTLAFQRSEYTSEAQAIAETLLSSKGYGKDDVLSYKRENLRGHSARTRCSKCGDHLDLDYDDLLAGEFDCPECGERQIVTYSEIKYDPVIIETIDLKDSTGHSAAKPAGHGEMPAKQLEGLGGWLFLWGIGLLLGLIVMLFNIIILATDFVASLFNASIFAYLLYSFFNRKRLFPKLAIILLSLSACLSLAEVILVDRTLDIGEAHSNLYRDVIGAIIAACIWIPYFLVSKRVKATFTRNGKKQVGLESAEQTETPESVDKKSGQLGYNEPDNVAYGTPTISAAALESQSLAEPAAVVSCRYCDYEMKPGFRYCPKCSKKAYEVQCSKCGRIMDSEFSFCPTCGGPTKGDTK